MIENAGILVVADAQFAEKVLRRLRETERITMLLSPRIFVVEGDKERAKALSTTPGITFATVGAVPESLIAGFSDIEALHIGAWNLRILQGKKDRPGEGLDWDAEGFEAP